MAERLVVIGGDAGGMTAASQARRLRGPDDLEILAFERGQYTSYSACGIPYFVGDVVKPLEKLIVRDPETFRDKQSIEARIRTEVTAIDLDARKVMVWDLEREVDYSEGFDLLMVATGAEPIRLDLPGADAANIFGVQVLGDGVAIRKVLDEHQPKKAVVVGSGYIGLEMAEAFTLRGLDVALVEQSEQPMATLDPDMGELITQGIRGLGVELHLGQTVQAFESTSGAVSGVVTESGTIPADIVVLGMGVSPNVHLARDAGLTIGSSGGIEVDRQMRTSAEGVWSAGDCAEKYHLISRRKVALPLGTHANKEGRVAGINIGGGYETFPGVLGTAVSKVCGLEVARTGLGESEAGEAGFSFVATTTESTTRAGYYPETSNITTKMLAELHSGRLLGAQIIGEEGAAKRIDVIAAALWNRMTVDDMLHLDLSYAPPFAPVWDPVLVAARKTWQAVEGSRD